MSGGYWGYIGGRIDADLKSIAESIEGDTPALARTLYTLGCVLKDIEYNLDMHYSGDTNIDNFDMFEKNALKALQGAVKAPTK